MTKEILGTDVNGRCDFTLPACELGAEVVLAAATETSTVVPTTTIGGASIKRAFFSWGGGADVFVAIGGSSIAAALPVGGTFSATQQELNPMGRQVTPGQTISVISATETYFNIRYDTGNC